jgi:STIP1 family protein 1
LDPISMEPLVDPVVAPSGYTYERSVILNEISARGLDPMTQQPLAESDLRPNRALKEMIEAYRQQRHGGGGGGGGR